MLGKLSKTMIWLTMVHARTKKKASRKIGESKRRKATVSVPTASNCKQVAAEAAEKAAAAEAAESKQEDV